MSVQDLGASSPFSVMESCTSNANPPASKQPRPKENPMRPLITALILLAACTDSNPNIHEPPAMTVSPSQAPDQTEQGSRKAAARLAEYYQFAAYGLPAPPENERKAKAEYWQKRAQEAQAK